MDSTRIHEIMDNLYIPKCNEKKANRTPVSHPTLIMQDYQADTCHRRACGCAGDSCYLDRVWWGDKGAAMDKDKISELKAMHTAYQQSSSSRIL